VGVSVGVRRVWRGRVALVDWLMVYG